MVNIALTRRDFRILLALATALLASGCERDAASQAQAETAQVFGAPDLETALALQPVTVEDREEFPLEGDMSCYFAENPAADPVLYARGFVRSADTRATMLVRYGDQVVQGSAQETGGFDAILDGGSFDTAALVLDVARLSEEEIAGAGSLVPYPAAMRLRQAGQPDRVMHGFWTCGA